MKIEERILRSISMREGNIILRRDISKFGSASSVSMALSNLIDRGKIVRIGSGVYAKARINKYTGLPTPDGVFEDLAVEALNRLGASVKPGKDMLLYNQGSTQIPALSSVTVSDKRINRKIKFGSQEIIYEANK